MSRLEEHLGAVSFPLLAAGGGAAFVMFLLIPRRHWQGVSLAVMVIVLTIARLPGLGSVASLCKVTSPLVFVLVGVAAWLSPGRRIKVPLVARGYVLFGLAAVFYLLWTSDRSFAVILRIQWLLMAMAAILTLRTVTDERVIRRILGSILVGQGVSVVITFSSLLVNKAYGIPVLFRYCPYYCNPNQIGILFSFTAAMALFFSTSSPKRLLRWLSFAVLVLSLAQLAMTVTRAGTLIFLITATPTLIVYCRRHPIIAFSGMAAAVVMGGYLMMQFSEKTRFRPVDDHDMNRAESAIMVMGWVAERPMFGLLMSGERAYYEGKGDPHNAYVLMLYLFGLSLSLPLFGIQLYGIFCAIRLWINRRKVPLDPMLLGLLVSFAPAMFLHGFINNIIYYPTYTWAFLNVFVSCFYITFWTRLEQSKQRRMRMSREGNMVLTAARSA